MFFFNTYVDETTGFTPHKLVFGKKAHSSSEFADQEITQTSIKYFDDLFTKITYIENIEKSKIKYKKYYDKTLNEHKF